MVSSPIGACDVLNQKNENEASTFIYVLGHGYREKYLIGRVGEKKMDAISTYLL